MGDFNKFKDMLDKEDEKMKKKKKEGDMFTDFNF